MKTTPIELLSPAKNLAVGMAAIDHGADAVYIGGPDFGAREKATNSICDIEQLCRHAALFDAKVYVTLNTLLYENEMEPARQLAWDCWNAGVDALIIQDMRLLDLDLPPIPLHASTQCDNLTVERVKQLEELGFAQVVLGRELTIDQIREIRRQTAVPLEFFVHGSLCVSHSGQCYLSEYIGNRSANRGACAQPCRLPWELVTSPSLREGGRGVGYLCLKDLNNSAHLEELMDAGITSFKIEGRMKEADYVKNVTAFYRQKIDEILSRRAEYEQASSGHCTYTFEVNPEKSFNRGFTDYFIHGRQKGIDAPFTPKSMGEYLGEVVWCNALRMEIRTDKTLHNGDGLCFLNHDDELIGIRADVVRPGRDGVHTVSTNRPHGAYRGAKIYRNYDIEWQRQVEASKGNRKIDIALTLTETDTGYELQAQLPTAHSQLPTAHSQLPTAHCQLPTAKISATNPDKATENIRKKALQWGDTPFNPISLELDFREPRLIPASVIGEMRRQLVEKLKDALVAHHQAHRSTRSIVKEPPKENPQLPTANCQLPTVLMTCHHCIRYVNGMCPKETGKAVGPLYIRNGENVFRLEFDCKKCLMYVCANE